MRRVCGALLLAVVFLEFGCGGAARRPVTMRKPWGKGALVPAIVCGVAGAGAGWGIASTGGSSSRVTCEGDPRCPDEPVYSESDPEEWQGALIGAAGGFVLCGILGHLFFDEAPALRVSGLTAASPTGMGGGPAGEAVRSKKRIILRGIYFDFDRTDIRPDSEPVLADAAALIAGHPEIESIVIEGHTDSQGSDEYNQDLSVQRAESVYRYLVNLGVRPEILLTEGYGKSAPVADNRSEAGRAQNRRVELRVVGRGGEPAASPAIEPPVAPATAPLPEAAAPRPAAEEEPAAEAVPEPLD